MVVGWGGWRKRMKKWIVDAATNNTLIDTCQPGAGLVLAYRMVMRRAVRASWDGSVH